MPKDSPWFKHDQNARGDPDICDMRAKYKAEGYGWYWMLIEMMREQDDYMLSLSRCNAFALQMQCSTAKADAFIRDCISTFELFSSDGERFWSDRLIRDMRDKDLKSEKAITAANTRWKNRPECGRNADAMQTQSDRNAIRKEENRREEKREENMADRPPTPTKKFTPPTVEEVAAYCRDRCNSVVAQTFHSFYEANGWKVGKNPMKDWKAAVRYWEKNGNNGTGPRRGEDFSDRNFKNQRQYSAQDYERMKSDVFDAVGKDFGK